MGMAHRGLPGAFGSLVLGTVISDTEAATYGSQFEQFGRWFTICKLPIVQISQTPVRCTLASFLPLSSDFLFLQSIIQTLPTTLIFATFSHSNPLPEIIQEADILLTLSYLPYEQNI